MPDHAGVGSRYRAWYLPLGNLRTEPQIAERAIGDRCLSSSRIVLAACGAPLDGGYRSPGHSLGEHTFLYLVLNKAQANLAMARRDLRVIEQEFFMAHPTSGGRNGDTQAFFPSTAGHR